MRPKPPWKERKVAHIAHLGEQPAEVRLVVACDKLHNGRCLVQEVREMGDSAFDCFNAGKSDVIWYYDAACSALENGWDHPSVRALRHTVEKLKLH